VLFVEILILALITEAEVVVGGSKDIKATVLKDDKDREDSR